MFQPVEFNSSERQVRFISESKIKLTIKNKNKEEYVETKILHCAFSTYIFCNTL